MFRWLPLLALLLSSCGSGGGPGAELLRFLEVSNLVGINHNAQHAPGPPYLYQGLGGGVAAGDYDGDGWIDLYLVGGDLGPNLLYRNRGDGTFEERAAPAGVALPGRKRCGPSFADFDGDGNLDLFVGGFDFAPCVLYRNRGDGTFEDATNDAGLLITRRHTLSAAWADYDRDGDLDLFLAHYGSLSGNELPNELLWRNNGDGTFTDVSDAAGISAPFRTIPEWIFTPNFADLDSDGWPDLLLASDFATSQLFRNNRDGTFTHDLRTPLTDENGMGGAIGDYDNDGDLDWFVTSILDEDGSAEGNWGVTGNRLYRNRGDGSFEDRTSASGTRHGHWGWGALFADLDLDGHLDLFHVNGAPPTGPEPQFWDDPSRLFLSNGNGSFREAADAIGIRDRGQGRGIAVLDYDGDGDLDLFVANAGEPPRLYRNDPSEARAWLGVRMRGPAGNSEGIGARVIATSSGATQMREIAAGNHYVSSSAAEAWFGFGGDGGPVTLRVLWPDGAESLLPGTPVNTLQVVRHPSLP